MPSTIAAQTLPSRTAPPSATTDGSITTIGSDTFAALLQGQMSADTQPGMNLNLDVAALFGQQELSTTEPIDPAQFLAAMGLSPFPPETIEKQAVSGSIQLSEFSSATSKSDTSLTTSLTALEGKSLTGTLTTLAPQKSEVTTEARIPAAPIEIDTTAKLAGFEQKLADSLRGSTEASAATQSLTPSVQSGNGLPGIAGTSGTAGALRAGGESLHVATPLRDQAWPVEFSQKVTWVATQDKQSAQLTLNPPQLGPIEISLSIKNDQATAMFVAHNAEVREMIESALPRLREALADAGVTLGQTNVSAESFQQAKDGKGNTGQGNRGHGGVEDNAGTAVIAETNSKRGNSLVDTFA